MPTSGDAPDWRGRQRWRVWWPVPCSAVISGGPGRCSTSCPWCRSWSRSQSSTGVRTCCHRGPVADDVGVGGAGRGRLGDRRRHGRSDPCGLGLPDRLWHLLRAVVHLPRGSATATCAWPACSGWPWATWAGASCSRSVRRLPAGRGRRRRAVGAEGRAAQGVPVRAVHAGGRSAGVLWGQWLVDRLAAGYWSARVGPA